MLEAGHPPDDWDRLLSESRSESNQLQHVVSKALAAQSSSCFDLPFDTGRIHQK
ncbi:MAG: hypothetical protein ACYDAM_11285 [Leptospirales bacterium]